MTSCPATPSTALAAPRRAQLSRRAAFYLQASITWSFLLGSSAPTPLYTIYQAAWGFSATWVTLVFGVYALAVLAALLVFGRLSDHVGRRPVLMAAAAAQVVAMGLLGSADGLGMLIAGRIVQGLSAGAAVAAVGAGLLDLDRARGTIANAIAPILGTASGGLVGALFVHFLPAPTHLVYGVLAVVFVLQGLGASRMPESISPARGAWASLRPRFALPAATRLPMLRAAPVLVAVWALGGFYASLGPRLLHAQFGFDASLAGGLTLFLMAAAGAAAVLAMHSQPAQALTVRGAALLLVGTAGVVGSLAAQSPALFFIGTVLAGMGFGVGFQGALREVVSTALPHERAGVLAIAFVISYLAMGLPAIVAGWAVAHGAAIESAATDFGLGVMGLAGSALLATLAQRRAVSAA